MTKEVLPSTRTTMTDTGIIATANELLAEEDTTQEAVVAGGVAVSSAAALLSRYNVEEEVCQIWLDQPGAGVQVLLDELLARRHRHYQEEEEEEEERCNSTCSGSQLLPTPLPAAPTKKRIKQAKAAIPYRRIADKVEDDHDDKNNNNKNKHYSLLWFDKEDFVHEALEQRKKYKAEKNWEQVNRITDGLTAMGIEIDDRYKTWRVVVVAAVAVAKNQQQQQQQQHATAASPLLTTTDGDAAAGSASSPSASASAVKCQMCGRSFASRNLVFAHLRDVTSGCGTSIWAQGKSVQTPPSVDKKLARRRRQQAAAQKQQRQQQQRGRRVVVNKAAATTNASNDDDSQQPLRTKQKQQQQQQQQAGDCADASLWMGDLPLAWTKSTLQKNKSKSRRGGGTPYTYKRLAELLYRHSLPNTPPPWIKCVVRKAYHSKRRRTPTTTNGKEEEQEQEASRDSGGEKEVVNTTPYLGYAIVVYRNADEATAARNHLHGLNVTVESVYGSTGSTNTDTTTMDKSSSSNSKKDYSDLPPSFTLVVRPAKKSSNSTNDDDNNNSNENNEGNVPTKQQKQSPPGLDPPLAHQLQPLSDDELRRRVLSLRKLRQRNEGDAHEDDKGGSADTLLLDNKKHHELVSLAVAEYNVLSRSAVRPERHYEGRLIPEHLRGELLSLLENLLWPAQHHRPILTSERYLVLVTSSSTSTSEISNRSNVHYKELREACRKLLQWADPDYYYSGIAVTKNFIASPHIDERDQSFQYAVSLGNFKSSADNDDVGGGQLCVEGKQNNKDEDEEDDNVFVNVVNTHNRIARVDGRCVHWVRTWTGGDRYSLIFYDTTHRHMTPILEGGVDLDYLLPRQQTP